MSMVCHLQKGCKETKGLCIHEKILTGAVVIGLASGLYFLVY